MKNLITLKDVTIRLGDRFLLPHTDWEIKAGENWAVLGPNGAGKSTLVRALTGDVPCVRGRLTYHGRLAANGTIGCVSWEEQERLLAREKAGDAARDFAHRSDGFETARTVILSGIETAVAYSAEFAKIVALAGVGNVLDRPVRFLSAGEMRKVLLARALVKAPQLLILDEPFGGIDAASRASLSAAIQALAAGGMPIILVTHRPADLLPAISRVMLVKDGAILRQGTREDVLRPDVLAALYEKPSPAPFGFVGEGLRREVGPEGAGPEFMIEMKDVSVRYGETVILDKLNWSVRRGENWAVAGPNGSGKTTLLRLITGDHLQAYANDIRLFGRARGSGESIWEIKERMGVVSTELQMQYRRDVKVEDVVASGLFDSIGLFRLLTGEQKRQVETCTRSLGLAGLVGRLFSRLSYGERRMVLLARAMVKSPELLVLDEPCQGLDRENRRFILGMIQAIGSGTTTQLLYVTHHPEELPACIRHILELSDAGRAAPRFRP